jgi:Fur family ferric uptake transcriptional regulator
VTREEARAAIRGVGLRATLQRIAVLEVLGRSERPLSPSEVRELLVAGANDRVTLYRNLLDLARAGLVRRVTLGGAAWRFEHVRELAHARPHPHFVCTSCGSVTCLPDSTLAIGPACGLRALDRGNYEVQVRGICDACERR